MRVLCPRCPRRQAIPSNSFAPAAACFNGQLAPLLHMAARGLVWYQGTCHWSLPPSHRIRAFKRRDSQIQLNGFKKKARVRVRVREGCCIHRENILNEYQLAVGKRRPCRCFLHDGQPDLPAVV